MGQLCWPQHRTVEFTAAPLIPIPRRVSLHPAPHPPRTPQNTQCLHCEQTPRTAVSMYQRMPYAQNMSTASRKQTSVMKGQGF